MPFGEFLDVSLFYDDVHVKGPTRGRGKRMAENVLLSLLAVGEGDVFLNFAS